jgi:hypothetical protein
MRQFEGWEIHEMQDVNLKRNTALKDPTDHALVVLRSGKKDPATGKPLAKALRRVPLPLPETPNDVRKRLVRFEDAIETINRSNLNFSWRAFRTNEFTGKPQVFPVNVCLRMIYKDKLWHGGRMYTFGPVSAQNLSRIDRRKIQISDRITVEGVAEFDFSGHAIRMLYHHYAKIDPDPEQDIYRPEVVFPRFYGSTDPEDPAREVARDFVKTVTNVCWNVNNPIRAEMSAEKTYSEHEDFDVLQRILKIERIAPMAVVRRIFNAHPDLEPWFFTRIGTDLTRLESRLMLKILLTFADAGKPALGIHDALLVRLSDARFAQKTMRDLYRKRFGFCPVIKRDF